MSLLNNTKPTKTALQLKIERLKATPSQMFVGFFEQWEAAMRAIWTGSDPQVVLDGIGTDAAELFALSQEVVKFLEAVKPGCTSATMALMKPIVVNPDGTVTITPTSPE